MLGFDPGVTLRFIKRTPRFIGEALSYRRAQRAESFPLTWDSLLPILTDYTAAAGAAEGHYFHQDLWAARRIFERRPTRHVDIGSRIDGFIAHLLVFMPVEVVDIRPLTSHVAGLQFVQEDATTLARFADGSVDSVSSLHAIEHFGLGRYGDPIDPNGHLAAMSALARVLAPGGRLYFSVPIGRERLVFNANRVFSPRTVVSAFSSLELVAFSAVDDAGRFVGDASLDAFETAEGSCGLFEFTKV
jgi:SAM-dependent methyltransferase